MDFLVLAPPVSTPAEPPSGAFLLAAGLSGHGYHAGLLDLSLEFYHRVLDNPEIRGPSTDRAVDYLLGARGGYTPNEHRSHAGVVHKKLGGFAKHYPGWKLTSMDIGFPGGVTDPEAMAKLLLETESPFAEIWDKILLPRLEELRPKRILVSLAYLSQLIATIDLVDYLERRGYRVTVGGSLPISLSTTGHGLQNLRKVFRDIELGDGFSLISNTEKTHLLERMKWPDIISPKPYISSRPVIPLALSTGCFWRRCLFCPDRDLPFFGVPTESIADFFASIPAAIVQRAPIVHFLDSAMPPKLLKPFLSIAKQYKFRFYGFARPTKNLSANRLLEEAAESGLSMLQLGVETGSQSLLDRYGKGTRVLEMEEVIHRSADIGIRTYLYLLFGLPEENEADRLATLEFVSRNADAVDFLNLSLFNLPRYCELTKRADSFELALRDFPIDNGIRLYRPFTYRGTSPRDDARKFLLKRFNHHPSIHPAILRTPRWFRAAHLALMKLSDRMDP